MGVELQRLGRRQTLVLIGTIWLVQELKMALPKIVARPRTLGAISMVALFEANHARIWLGGQ